MQIQYQGPSCIHPFTALLRKADLNLKDAAGPGSGFGSPFLLATSPNPDATPSTNGADFGSDVHIAKRSDPPLRVSRS